MAQTPTTDPVKDQQVEATAWFAVLANAKATHGFAKAAKTQERLRELGVDVRFRRAPVRGEGER